MQYDLTILALISLLALFLSSLREIPDTKQPNNNGWWQNVVPHEPPCYDNVLLDGHKWYNLKNIIFFLKNHSHSLIATLSSDRIIHPSKPDTETQYNFNNINHQPQPLKRVNNFSFDMARENWKCNSFLDLISSGIEIKGPFLASNSHWVLYK